MLYRLLRNPYKAPKKPEIKEYPSVCIQLPVYNEPKVIDRLISAVLKIEYPKDKLEIQVLDDSSDETSSIIDKRVENIDSSINIEVVRREKREGYKAGALSYGLNKTEAELIAIFDADFIPDKDFLHNTVAYFNDEKLAFVQTRWGFVNRARSLLTKAQSLLIDAHFVIEHTARHGFSFFNFNGTAGVWRKEAIKSAGGWQGDTITEDLDLSYRALLNGYKAIYLKDIVCDSELPEDIEAFKSQQYRWMKGSAQVFKKLIKPILKSDLPFNYKLEAFFHLSANFCYPLMLITGLLSIPASILRSNINFTVGLWFEFLLFFATLGSMIVFYYYSQSLQGRKVSAKDILLAIALGVGIGAHCARASLAGVFSSVGEFVRTPKSGTSDKASEVKECVSYREGFSNLKSHKKEVIIATYLCFGVLYLLLNKYLLSVPFAMLIVAGYVLVLYSAFCPTVSKN